ncbi:hypothetical protein BuS5_03711 [Desulfosarcina sp. BuS5]|uniref:glycosyltransferase n=1 Tax=Desulfosarcina sp. BuS5 TaxID=933262 RepID=UPI00048284DB|nr:glycosyltransferase [Desulfosarcina sp. BuS5]WDN90740.1 hypothetical protein BuS5_03711 [Desulfosarcina sp. BuS5]
MKMALVIPWFGKDLKGGAEQQAWQIAKRFTDRKIDIEVLTTCSKDFLSDWSENFYEAKEYVEDEIKIKRFKVKQRDTLAFDSINLKLMQVPKTSFIPGLSPLSNEEEQIFLNENIYSPDLHNYIVKQKGKYDIFLFLPYLFPNIIKGINAVKEKAVIQPCLHNESYAYLDCVQENFYNAKSILFLSSGEYEVAQKIFGPSIIHKSKVVYGGVEVDQHFDIKYSQYLLYLGRRDKGKNTHLLIESFDKFVEETNSDLKLMIAGVGELPVQPKSENIVDLGLVSEEQKSKLLSECLSLINPSENESFSRVIFESWYAKKPIIVNKKCLATYNALIDAGEAGFSADTQDGFVEVLKKINIMDIKEIKSLGEKGFIYAKEIANWDKVIDRYIDEFNIIANKIKSNKNKRIILTYFNIGKNDAVGFDILYEYEILKLNGYDDVAIYAEEFDPALDLSRYNIINKKNLNSYIADLDTTFIYHHANYWENGYQLLSKAKCKIIVKYHNITPPDFFKPYFEDAYINCRNGIEQTKKIVILKKDIIFFADSQFNADELIEYGAKPLNVRIHPPFYKYNELKKYTMIDSKLSSDLQNSKSIKLLFVGRVSPNKGHKHLIEVMKAYRDNYGTNIELNIVGGIDPNLNRYFEELLTLIDRYQLNPLIKFHNMVSIESLKTFYINSDIFLVMSEHEGFCVPVLEAQYYRLPVIALNTTAVGYTIGKEQLIFNDADYITFAAAIHIVYNNKSVKDYLIENGILNYKKYYPGILADKFIDDMENLQHNSIINNGVKVIHSKVFERKGKKILTLKLDHNGDLILAIPALSKLRSRYRDAQIDIIVGSWNVEIAEKLNLFDNIYTFDYFKMQSSKSPKVIEKEVVSLLSKLEKYDIAIDLRRQRDTRFLLTRVVSDLHVGYQVYDEIIDKKLEICLDSQIDQPYKIISHNKESISLQMLRLIDSLPSDINDYIFFPSLSSKKTTGTQIAIFPKAGNSIKEWPLENFVKLSKELSKNSSIDAINVYLTKNDAKLADYFTKIDKLSILCGLNYSQLFDSLQENSIAIVNNSFGAHICSYLNLNTIAIYGGQETVEEWEPVYGKNTIIYSDVSCSPCHCPSTECCKYDLVCLRQINVGIVKKEILNLIQGKINGNKGDAIKG